MQKKKIIGISSFAGSNIPLITHQIRKLQSHTIYYLTYFNREEIAKNILKPNIFIRLLQLLRLRSEYSIIDSIVSVEEIEWFEKEFETAVFKPILVEVPWEECLTFMKKNKIISWNGTLTEYRQQYENDPYRKNILRCREYRNIEIIKCHEGCINEVAGEIVDLMLRM
jgi:hypothetical protein